MHQYLRNSGKTYWELMDAIVQTDPCICVYIYTHTYIYVYYVLTMDTHTHQYLRNSGKTYWELMDAIVQTDPPTLPDNKSFSSELEQMLTSCLQVRYIYIHVCVCACVCMFMYMYMCIHTRM